MLVIETTALTEISTIGRLIEVEWICNLPDRFAEDEDELRLVDQPLLVYVERFIPPPSADEWLR